MSLSVCVDETMSKWLKPANKSKQVALDWKPFIARLGLEGICSYTDAVPFCPSPEKASRREFGHCHPVQQHGFGLFPQLSVRKTLGEGRAEGLQYTSRTCSLLSFSTYRSAPYPEWRWHRCNPASNFLGGIKKKKKQLEDKFGPEGGVNPQTLCRSISAAHHNPPGRLCPRCQLFQNWLQLKSTCS